MKAFVYGTLKRGYGNNIFLRGAKYIGDYTLPGYKLLDAGFPVAVPSDDASILGELFEITEDHLPGMDRLEGEGRMYNRVYHEDHDLSLYVGHPNYWEYDSMRECPQTNNVYEWGR